MCIFALGVEESYAPFPNIGLLIELPGGLGIELMFTTVVFTFLIALEFFCELAE